MNTFIASIRRVALGALGGLAAPALAADAPALADYQPAVKVSGTLRTWGDDQMAPLMHRWQEGFKRYHPEVRYEDTLKGNNSAMYGVQEWVADMGLTGRRIYANQMYGTFRRSMVFPVQVAVATTSFDVPRKAPALAIFVNKNNPLAKLTMAQLDGIFGAERTGGWDQLKWHAEVGRGPEKNLVTWGQLGLTGEWAKKPIHPYGPPKRGAGSITYFQTAVFGGADNFAEDYHEYVDPKAMLEAVAKDPLGIAYAGLPYANPQVKPLALAATEGGAAVPLTRATVADRSYPLARLAYINFAVDRPNGDVVGVDPKVREFLKYVLSKQGQQDVQAEGDYLPLTPALVQAQLAKLK
jgi:phosphate transport system substrate-binding protein